MACRWHIPDSRVRELPALSNLEQCFALGGERVSRGPKSDLVRGRIDNDALYIKRYTRGGKFWRRYLGRSRARAEWENLLLFQSWGLDTPELVAYGERYQRGCFQRGAIVTREVPGAVSLERLAQAQHPMLQDPALLRNLICQLAAYAHTLHSKGFCHNDLDWRNILVVPPMAEQPLRILLLDCPGGRFWTGPLLEHRIIKDLAHLDKLARKYLSLRWRLRFYRQYTGRKKWSAADKIRLKKINGFFDKSRYRSWLRW